MPKVLKRLTLNKEVVTRVSDNQMNCLWGGYDNTPTLGVECGGTSPCDTNTCINECDCQYDTQEYTLVCK
jgi:hypothetical protein